MHPRLHFEGDAPHAACGAAVAPLGDVDGDDRPDFAIGLPGRQGAGPQAGEVRVFTARGKTLHVLSGVTAQDGTGRAVAAAGDVNADGHHDILVSAWHAAAGQPRTGVVRIYSGQSGRVLRTLRGEAVHDDFGASIASADLDGDGTLEFLVGAPGAAGGAGKVYVFGSSDEPIHVVTGAAGERLGAAVAAAGDRNGDGNGDLLVGAPGAAGGRVVVLSGASGEELDSHRGDGLLELGAALAGGRDLDGDRVPDVLAGAPATAQGKGAVVAWSGKTGEELFRLEGKGAAAAAGSALSWLGDVDGDEVPDFAYGAPGARGTGSVWLHSGATGAKLLSFFGESGGMEFGKSLCALADPTRGRRPELLVGAPGMPSSGQRSGAAWIYPTPRLDRPVAKAHGEPVLPAPASARFPADLLDQVAKVEGWNRLMDEEQRWVLYGDQSPALMRETAELLIQLYARLDDVLGEDRPAVDGPVVLAFVRGRDDVAAITNELGRRYPHLAEWAQSVTSFPRVQVFGPLLAIVRHDASLAEVKRPEVQIVHMAVQMELQRRFGRQPYWVGESLGYALQDELVGGVYGYSFRGAASLDEEYHQGWKWNAREALAAGGVTLASLVAESGVSFEQQRAYVQFGLASWWLSEKPAELRQMLRSYATARGAGHQVDVPWEPDTTVQSQVLRTAFGHDFLEEATVHWASASVEGGPGARLAAILSAFGAISESSDLESYEKSKGRIRLFSDFRSRDAKKALAMVESTLERLDKALGEPDSIDDSGLLAGLIADRETYRNLCEALAAADPSHARYLLDARNSTGFTLYAARLTVYFHDLAVQEESSAPHSLAHSLVHVELHRRYGALPLWLAEGLAYAGQEGASGEVWAYWNRDEFVAAASHGEWRNRASLLLEPRGKKGPRIQLSSLYRYSAKPYEDDLAHVAFAFATYGLDKDRKGFQAFVELLQKEYRENWKGGGRFTPEPELVERLVEEAFGPDFAEDFHAYWEDPPKRRR